MCWYFACETTNNDIDVLIAVLARNLRRVHNEIHNIRKPREALPSQVFQVAAKSNQRAKGWQRARAGKGHILLHLTRPQRAYLKSKGHSAFW